MFDFTADPDATKEENYRLLADAAAALVAGEHDTVANMANIAALLWEFLPDLNWAGFYRVVEGELVLGPFQGRPACVRIARGAGVCGAALASGETQCVEDVHAFPGHIACDAASRSELVIPVRRDGAVIAIVDLDSPITARFDTEDVRGIERLVARLDGFI